MQTLSTMIVGLVALASGVGTIYLMHQAGPHGTLGTGPELWSPAVAAVIVGLLSAVLFGLGAWVLWRPEHKMASQLLGILAVLSPIMIWKGVDAANVLYDTSTGVRHDMMLIEMRRNKNEEFFARSALIPESAHRVTMC